MEVLTGTRYTNLGAKRVGKVRDLYEQDERLILVTTDRHSSFDRIIAHIPWKGQVLNQLSEFWFNKTEDIVRNHMLDVPDPNAMVVEKCAMVPIECVVRGYITGVTDTSLWTLYAKGGRRDFGNFTLPDGLRKNEKLERPVFTPTTKSDEHDRPVTPQEAVAEGIVPKELMDELERVSLALYARGADIARQRGLILVDTKYEFGLDPEGGLVLIDEVHTPDSSRYWQLDSYDERFAAGKDPEFFDKEFLRLWFKEHCDPYKDATLPEAPPEMIEELSRRYIHMYETLTGGAFHRGETPIEERIERNLQTYRLPEGSGV